MELTEIIEELHLDNFKSNEIKYQLADGITSKQAIDLTKLFLKGIGNNHDISGKTIYKMQDMIYQYQDEGNISRDQKIYLISQILDQWHQLDITKRAELYL